ncbi:hypothetical protein WICPIJ_003111 [Wickerhamomyces pijperi]|uniref:Uncharacterized protein n=1 Tax=Wickerhamomyces pijperi TaxID=599730 RepID=A0A9P8TP08_WICPI|nr:hypothetical protein WICPIJ_003111 [Wickerhamomyces pijperi]
MRLLDWNQRCPRVSLCSWSSSCIAAGTNWWRSGLGFNLRSCLLSIILTKSFKLSSIEEEPPGVFLSMLEDLLKLDLLVFLPNEDEYLGVPPLELNSTGNPWLEFRDDGIDLGIDEVGNGWV